MYRLISILTLTIAASGGVAQESWVGKTILTKEYGIKIGYTDDAGRQVHVGELTLPDYKVTEDRGGWLQVTNEQGLSGWFDKEQAVLLEDAPAYFSGLIRKDPKDANAYFMRAIARSITDELDLAINDLSEVLRLEPGYAGAYGQRANLFDRKKEYVKAVADYSQSLRLEPTANNYANRARTYSRLKQYDKARADFEAALRIDPKWISAYDGLAWMLATCPDAKHRDGKQAVEIAKKGLALAPKDASLMDTLAAAYVEVGDLAQAVHWYGEVLRVDPNADAYFDRGRTYRRMKEYAKARADFEAALRLDPEWVNAHDHLAWLLATCPEAKIRDGKEAVAIAKKGLALAPKDASLMDTLAAAYAELGDFDQAVSWQERALQDASWSNPETRGRLDLYRKKEPYRQDP